MKYDVIVIGGGQAGLAAGYFLKKTKRNFIILDEQGRTGDSWRNRYDSLTLFTPRSYSSLPGLEMKGQSDGYPKKDEVADYLESYRVHFNLPVIHHVKVIELYKDGSHFIVKTSGEETYLANQAVVATGAFHTPFTPAISKTVNTEILQMHASAYRSPEQIPPGKVLIVGAGNTGVQIAAELTETHTVVLSCSKKIKALPLKWMGKSLFWWLDFSRLSKVTAESGLGKWIKGNDPIIGEDLKKVKGNALMAGRLAGFENKAAVFNDQKKMEVQTVIWATGYRNDYQWIHISGAIDDHGRPIHQRGVSDTKGLYFIGLSWQHKRGSALIHGVGDDAGYLVRQM